MKISILQPNIERGNISSNLRRIQNLIYQSNGNLLVLPEYALTGSLVLDKEADLKKWISESKEAKDKLSLPSGKKLIFNSVIQVNDEMYNCCELIPDGIRQYKRFPDTTELDNGIRSGEIEQTFEFAGLKYKVIICTDLRHIKQINLKDMDFLLFIFHFTNRNYNEAMHDVKVVSKEYDIPILISSIVSDMNIGYSSYVHNNLVIGISDKEGILEVEI